MFAYAVIALFILFFLAMMFLKEGKTLETCARLFLALLLGGFTVAGLLATITGVTEYVRGLIGVEQLLVQVGAGLLFSGAGGAALYVYFIRFPLQRARLMARHARYPDSPWKWDPRWQTNLLVYRAQGPIRFTWLVLSGLAVGLLFVGSMNRETIAANIRSGDMATIVFFGLLAAILLPCVIAAVRLLKAGRTHGDSTFEMTSFPAAVGGQVTGLIHTSIKGVPDCPCAVELHCRRLDSRPRPRRRTRPQATIVWSAAIEVPADRMRGGAQGLSIPIAVSVPADARETDVWSPGQEVTWTLTAAVSVAGVPYFSSFEIPVFRIG